MNLVMENIKCISFDGIDGSGKTTLINSLLEKYNVVLLPRFYYFGMVPMDFDKRKEWFRTKYDIETMKIYAVSHRNRILLANDYKKGFHYKFIENDERKKLIVLDRGILSVEAFIYAALKLSTPMTQKEIMDYIDVYFRNKSYQKMNSIIDHTFLLVDEKQKYLNQVLNRRMYDERDKNLIRYQAEYYQKKLYIENKLTTISPISILKENISKCTEYIEQIFNESEEIHV